MTMILMKTDDGLSLDFVFTGVLVLVCLQLIQQMLQSVDLQQNRTHFGCKNRYNMSSMFNVSDHEGNIAKIH